MDGSTLLSETLAQYSALMVMERELGRDMMRKFLKYEMEYYLRGRALDSCQERPLASMTRNQAYIHYRKGAVIMYQLKEMIGEEKINAALKTLLGRFQYRGPPYPTSIDLIEALRSQTPAKFEGLIDDMFHKVILYANRTLSAGYHRLENGQYQVTLVVECRKFESGKKMPSQKLQLTTGLKLARSPKLHPARCMAIRFSEIDFISQNPFPNSNLW